MPQKISSQDVGGRSGTHLPEEPEKLSQRAYQDLRRRIVGGELEPGQRLSLRKVASTLGMSIAPVGEALRELNRDGLVEIEPGWGARVRRLDAETLRNQHVLRIALECEAARQCSARISEPQLVELTRLAAELDQRIDSHAEPQQIYELDSQFHLRIAQLSGAPVLFEGLKANQLVRMLARGSRIAHSLKRPPHQHLDLVESMRTRDPATAAQAMREHCARSMELQLAYLPTSEMES